MVDLDHGMFEVFAGAELKDKIAENRFNDIGGEGDTVPTLVKSFSVTELPTAEEEFITTLNKASSEKKWRNEQRKREQTSAMSNTTVYPPAPQWTTDGSRCSNLGEWRSIYQLHLRSYLQSFSPARADPVVIS